MARCIKRSDRVSVKAQYVVGIDLGTSHTVVAYAPVSSPGQPSPRPEPAIFSVEQRVGAHTQAALPLLPSVLYAPPPGEVDGDPSWVAGEYARRRSFETAGRSVASAKSWLSHAAVDRTASILPWGATDPDLPKVSPVEASAAFLTHVRNAWNASYPDTPLERQGIVLTVPASFDEVARRLTLLAAEQAGLSPTLLEEPTAAFYDSFDEDDLRALSNEGDQHVLVCDVGGGTTDLSLLHVRAGAAGQTDAKREAGATGGTLDSVAEIPRLVAPCHVDRVAVGRHLLLGGDNMDLALAHVAEAALGPPSLSPTSFAQLVASCRHAKEAILMGASEASVTILGEGSRLVGGARTTTLSRSQVESIVVEGFFPRDRGPAPPTRGAVVSFGLPYERDPAITRHVRAFLLRHAVACEGPLHVLLNGGVFRAKPLITALKASLAGLTGFENAQFHSSSDPELAVARGAVRYGLSLRGIGYRVAGGASRGYYVRVEGEPDAPARPDGPRGVCVIGRGAGESTVYDTGRTFELIVGRTVRFELYASDEARHLPGAVVVLDDTFEKLPPLVTALPAHGVTSRVCASLCGEALATGQLEISCVEVDSDRRHVLEFQLRTDEGGLDAPDTREKGPSPRVVPSHVSPPARASRRVAERDGILDRVFGKKSQASGREVKDVVRDLERELGERSTWSLETCRSLADGLLENPGARRRSALHEKAFWLLLGFGLRPGFGDPADPARMRRACPLLDGRLGYPGESGQWQHFFIAWRRLGGGLDEARQTAIRETMDPFIAPLEAGLKQPKKALEAREDLLVLLSSLERVDARRRATLGDWIMEKTWVSNDARLYGSLGKVGARVPAYASAHFVVPAARVEGWLERMLRLDWSKHPSVVYAAAQMARRTEDRARNVSDRIRVEVEKRLQLTKAPPSWLAFVREYVPLAEQERATLLGESLPLGLRLGPTDALPP